MAAGVVKGGGSVEEKVIDEDDDLGDVELGEAACELGEACEACQ